MIIIEYGVIVSFTVHFTRIEYQTTTTTIYGGETILAFDYVLSFVMELYCFFLFILDTSSIFS